MHSGVGLGRRFGAAAIALGRPTPVGIYVMSERARQVTLLACAGLVLLACWLGLRQPGWRRANRLSPAGGTHLSSIDADVFFVDAAHLARRGPPGMVVVRLNTPMALVPYHFAQQELAGPLPIEDWSHVLRAPIVFNAGQFDNNLQYLGWLKSQGVWLSAMRKPAWMGLLVSQPDGSGPCTRVVDLEQAPADVVGRYANVMQSMMLVVESARVRVRRSALAACRTVIAEDTRGRLLILATEGAVTLFDLAEWLPKSGFDIVRAMNLDGGIESQLVIDTPELKIALYGQYGTDTTLLAAHAGMGRYPLPAVVAVQPAVKTASPAPARAP
jgi:hypothetical protein